MKFAAALLATVAARHHHHHHESQLLETMEAYEAMNEDQLLVSLESKLSQAQQLEATVAQAQQHALQHPPSCPIHHTCMMYDVYGG